MKEIVAGILALFLGGLIFSVLCFTFDAPTYDHVVFAIMVDAFTGLLAAPEVSPESFRQPRVFQVFSGISVGLGVGLFFSASLQYSIGLCLVGAVIGFFAKQFADVIQAP